MFVKRECVIFPTVMASVFKSQAEHLDGLLLTPKCFIQQKANIFSSLLRQHTTALKQPSAFLQTLFHA